MTNQPEHAAGSHPVGADHTSGRDGDRTARDQSGLDAGEADWNGAGVVRDQGANDAVEPDSGWSGGAVVRDQGEIPEAEAGGWSADEVVKDHGEQSGR